MTLEQVNEAMMNGSTVIHTHMGISARYKVTDIRSGINAKVSAVASVGRGHGDVAGGVAATA